MVSTGQTSGLRWLGLVLGLVLSQASPARAQKLPDQPRDFVVDLAGVINRDTFHKLNGFLLELEQKTTAQVIVLTVNSTGGVPIRDFALRTAEKWKLGRKDRDNGVLVVVATQDRQWTIEVGYGLEATLPDALCGRVGRELFIPSFKRGDYSGGIYEGTLVLANRIAAASGAEIAGMPARTLSDQPAGRRSHPPVAVARWIVRAVFILIVVSIISTIFGRARYIRRHSHYTSGLWLWLLLGGLGGGYYGRRSWGGGSWGGGSWGGGFGGGSWGGGSFGGGGGGSFGGGGASGGW
jgi:uncharacterized protein